MRLKATGNCKFDSIVYLYAELCNLTWPKKKEEDWREQTTGQTVQSSPHPKFQTAIRSQKYNNMQWSQRGSPQSCFCGWPQVWRGTDNFHQYGGPHTHMMLSIPLPTADRLFLHSLSSLSLFTFFFSGSSAPSRAGAGGATQGRLTQRHRWGAPPPGRAPRRRRWRAVTSRNLLIYDDYLVTFTYFVMKHSLSMTKF